MTTAFVNALRTWRTVRHLAPRQIVWRLACRGRFRLLRRTGPASVAAAARRLPLPDSADPRLGRLAGHVLPWQRAVHGQHLAAMLRGKFVLLGRAVDFGNVADVRWRKNLGEGNVALWRMTLGYFGYAPPLLAGGDPAALRAVASLVESLERQNPFAAPGVFRDIWNPYCASHRLVNLLLGLHLFERRATAPADARAKIVSHVRFCAAFVRGNLERDLGYNHLLKNLTALVAYAAALPALPRRWTFLHRAVPAAVAQQVLADGGHAERSPMYHMLALLDLLLLVDAGVLSPPAADAVAQQLRAMRIALAALTHPDGDIALFNDAWLGEAPAARTFAMPATKATAATRLPQSGYVQLRSRNHAAVFDCGACGPDDNPAHAHADFLAVEATVAGHRFLVDAGVATYDAGPLRDRCRSAAAHNGPRFAGCEPVEFWGSFRVGRRARAYPLPCSAKRTDVLCCAGWHDGYRLRGVRTARCLALYPRRGLLIVDLWAGAGAGSEAVVDFLIPALWQRLNGGRYRHVADGTRTVFIPLAGAADSPRATRHWPRYGAAEDAFLVRVAPEARGGERWCACWLGWGGEPPAADVAVWQADLAAALARA